MVPKYLKFRLGFVKAIAPSVHHLALYPRKLYLHAGSRHMNINSDTAPVCVLAVVVMIFDVVSGSNSNSDSDTGDVTIIPLGECFESVQLPDSVSY